MTPISQLSISPVRLATSDGALAPADLGRAALLGTVDRVVGLVAREGGFAREDASKIWAQLAGAATGQPHVPATATANGGADVYGTEALGRDLLGQAGVRSPTEEGQVLRALDDFTRAVSTQLTANRRQPAATALGPVALAVAEAGQARPSADAATAIATALRTATFALERQLK